MAHWKHYGPARTIAAVALGAASALALPLPAQAHDILATDAAPTVAAGSGEPTYLVAVLDGRNEVPTSPGQAAGDPDGQAVQVLRIRGDQVAFAVSWTGIDAPSAGALQGGAAGVTGPVSVPLFGAGVPGTVHAVTGAVTVTDPAQLDALRTDPGGFYVNLDTAAYPDGAVRGQLHTVGHPIDLTAVLHGGPLTALLDGDQQVHAAGDPDGHAGAFVAARGRKVDFSATWSGIGAPTDAHLHAAATGVTGPVSVTLFAAPTGLPASINGVAGTVAGVDPGVLKGINAHPAGWYADLHTADFPDGAVRGQLFRSGNGSNAAEGFPFAARVLTGAQIYACTQQPGGTFAFTQHNVSAHLAGGIKHSFVTDDAGPPQWIAPDRSAVTGAVISKTPHGDGNIAELDLTLTQTGSPRGLLAHAVEVERLNTAGGVAPTGSCNPDTQPIANVPYQADYLFITN